MIIRSRWSRESWVRNSWVFPSLFRRKRHLVSKLILFPLHCLAPSDNVGYLLIWNTSCDHEVSVYFLVYRYWWSRWSILLQSYLLFLADILEFFILYDSELTDKHLYNDKIGLQPSPVISQYAALWDLGKNKYQSICGPGGTKTRQVKAGAGPCYKQVQVWASVLQAYSCPLVHTWHMP